MSGVLEAVSPVMWTWWGSVSDRPLHVLLNELVSNADYNENNDVDDHDDEAKDDDDVDNNDEWESDSM